jgi:hypothetical protein
MTWRGCFLALPTPPGNSNDGYFRRLGAGKSSVEISISQEFHRTVPTPNSVSGGHMPIFLNGC